MNKIIVIIIFYFLPLVCYGQMQRSQYIGDPFNYVTYTSNQNKVWVIIQPGNGAASYDISTLGNIGYGKFATTTTLPFNLLIVQAKKGTTGIDDYLPIKNNWSLTFIKLGIKKAILTGYSLGGKETIRELWIDHTGVFIGFVAMCGDYPYGPETELRSDVVSTSPIFLLAGDKDTQISWYQSNTVNNMVNKVHPGQSTMVIIPGGSHSDAWIKGYDFKSTTQDYGKLVYNFINSIINNTSQPIHCQALLDTINNTAVFTLPDSTLYKTTIIKQ